MPRNSSPPGSGVRDPRYRADCFEFFHHADETELIALKGPAIAERDLVGAIERRAEQTGRYFNDELLYAFAVAMGERPPDFQDSRSAADWRALLAPMYFRFDEDKGWTPCSVLFPHTHTEEG